MAQSCSPPHDRLPQQCGMLAREADSGITPDQLKMLRTMAARLPGGRLNAGELVMTETFRNVSMDTWTPLAQDHLEVLPEVDMSWHDNAHRPGHAWLDMA